MEVCSTRDNSGFSPIDIVLNGFGFDRVNRVSAKQLSQNAEFDFVGLNARGMFIGVHLERLQQPRLTLFPRMSRLTIWRHPLKAQTVKLIFSEGLGEVARSLCVEETNALSWSEKRHATEI